MSLSDFITAAWADHAEQPEQVAHRLAEVVPRAQSTADVAPLANLVVHVHGEHLGRWDEALVLLARLHAGPAVAGDAAAADAVARATATLRLARGDADALDGLAPAERAAALAGAAAVLTGRREIGRAGAALAAALAAAESGLPAGSPALRALAVAGNNIAAELEERASRSPDETALMLRAAEVGLGYWTLAGTWLQHERAAYRLARCRLAAGLADDALASARQCLAICEDNDAPAFERFFAQAVVALASRAAGDAATGDTMRTAALACHATLPEDEKRWCEAELAELR